MSGHAEPAPAQGQASQYKILGRIASGGMGAVYLGERAGDTGPSRLVAIKVIHPHLAENRVFVDMLMDEARVASRIHHRNVVGIIDVGAFGNRHFVVMPYVEGGTLSELVRRETRHLPIALVAHVLGEALEGLHAAHSLVDEHGRSLGLVHRDVSPGNILIGTDGVARVIDFGVAKAATRITQTAPGTVKGKFSYMAPEQAMGEQIDCRADVFAAGVVLWTVLTGKRLFTGKNSAHTIRNLMSTDILPPSQVRPKVPRAFDEVCLRALHRSPYKRYQSAAEMAAALRQAAQLAGREIAPDAVGKLVSEVFADRIQQRRTLIAQSRRTSRSITVEQPGFDRQVADLEDHQSVDGLTPPTPSARVRRTSAAVPAQSRLGSDSTGGADMRQSETLSSTPELGERVADASTSVTFDEAQPPLDPRASRISGALVPLSREEVVARTRKPRRYGKYVLVVAALALVGLGAVLRDQLLGLLPPGLLPGLDAPSASPSVAEPVRIAVEQPAAPVAPVPAAAPDATAAPEAPGELLDAAPAAPPGEPAGGAAGAVDAGPAGPGTEAGQPAPAGAEAAQPGTAAAEASPKTSVPADSVTPSGKPARPRRKPVRRPPRPRPAQPTLDLGTP